MFVEAVKKIKKSMFPIFRVTKIDETRSKIGVAGTGFFISGQGHFVSVAHLFDDMGPDVKFYYHGQLPNHLQPLPLEISEVARDDGNDIFVGGVPLTTTEPVSLADELPDEGRSVCISGYPMATITSNAQGGAELGGVRRYFQPSFVLDLGKIGSKGSNGVIRTHDGFLVRDVGLFGMSGGPVFDVDGNVVGIQGSVTEPRVSQNGSRTITTENAMVIRSSLVIELLKTNNLPFVERQSLRKEKEVA